MTSPTTSSFVVARATRADDVGRRRARSGTRVGGVREETGEHLDELLVAGLRGRDQPPGGSVREAADRPADTFLDRGTELLGHPAPGVPRLTGGVAVEVGAEPADGHRCGPAGQPALVAVQLL